MAVEAQSSHEPGWMALFLFQGIQGAVPAVSAEAW